MMATETAGEAKQAPMADRYRAQARVGIGGTAVVYRCVDLHTERIVAVKVLRTNGPLIPEAAARFRREAHLAATLAHPHIVRMLDYGYTFPPVTGQRVPWAEDPNRPVPYLAMEYVFGVTLKELVRRYGPLPIAWVWRIGEQLCSALAAAHAAGVVHRDVKPQNVMALDAPLELLTKLTDFGIARQVNGDFTTLTATGQVIGTPDYLSPEQVVGEPGGPSSDLYSLGVVLYELLTAHLPFEAETPLAAASRRMVADPPPLTAYRRDIPAPLQEVVLLALRRDAGDRFANAQEFAQALRWSREQSPPQPAAQRGAWALTRRPHPSQPPQSAPERPGDVAEAVEQGGATDAGPSDSGAADDAADVGAGLADEMSDEMMGQSTVLRVTTHLPELEGELRPEDRLPIAESPLELPGERLPDVEAMEDADAADAEWDAPVRANPLRAPGGETADSADSADTTDSTDKA